MSGGNEEGEGRDGGEWAILALCWDLMISDFFHSDLPCFALLCFAMFAVILALRCVGNVQTLPVVIRLISLPTRSSSFPRGLVLVVSCACTLPWLFVSSFESCCLWLMRLELPKPAYLARPWKVLWCQGHASGALARDSSCMHACWKGEWLLVRSHGGSRRSRRLAPHTFVLSAWVLPGSRGRQRRVNTARASCSAWRSQLAQP